MGYSTGAGRIVQDLATAQKGVFSLGQAVNAGVAKSVVLERHSSQRLFRVYRGAYSPSRRVSQEGIWMAGVLSAGEGSVLSHMSALRLYGITRWTGPTEVLRSSSPASRERSDGQRGCRYTTAVTEKADSVPVLKIRTTRNLHDSEVTVYDGIPVTTIARTFIDICGSIGEGQLRSLLHEAAREGQLKFGEIREAMGRARGKRGVKLLRMIIDGWDPQTALTKNDFEKGFKRLCQKERLPVPLVNRMVGGYRVDFFFPEYGLVVETDGGQDHNVPHGVERDKDRDSDLQLKGFIVLRLTWGMLNHRPERSMEKVKGHLDLCHRQKRRADPGWETASVGS